MEAGSVLGGPLGPGWRYLPVNLISAERFNRHNSSLRAGTETLRNTSAVPITGIVPEG